MIIRDTSGQLTAFSINRDDRALLRNAYRKGRKGDVDGIRHSPAECRHYTMDVLASILFPIF